MINLGMLKFTNCVKKLIIIVVIAAPLAAAPVRGLFASINLGCRYTSQNHDYTNNTGAVGKETKGELATSFGLSFGMLNQVEKINYLVYLDLVKVHHIFANLIHDCKLVTSAPEFKGQILM